MLGGPRVTSFSLFIELLLVAAAQANRPGGTTASEVGFSRRIGDTVTSEPGPGGFPLARAPSLPAGKLGALGGQ